MERKAPAFAPRKQQLAAGAVGGVFASRQLTGSFASRLITPLGEYELSVTDVGLAVTHADANPTVMRWSKIDAWAVDKEVLMVRDTTGNTMVLPRNGLPEEVFDMIIEICEATLKGAQLSLARNYGRWANLSASEKVLRGAIYSVGVLVVFCSVLVFARFGVTGAFS